MAFTDRAGSHRMFHSAFKDQILPDSLAALRTVRPHCAEALGGWVRRLEATVSHSSANESKQVIADFDISHGWDNLGNTY
jgi:hypothetical protein